MIIICMDLWILDVVLPFVEIFGCNLLLNSYASMNGIVHQSTALLVSGDIYLVFFYYIRTQNKYVVDNDYEIEM